MTFISVGKIDSDANPDYTQKQSIIYFESGGKELIATDPRGACTEGRAPFSMTATTASCKTSKSGNNEADVLTLIHLNKARVALRILKILSPCLKVDCIISNCFTVLCLPLACLSSRRSDTKLLRGDKHLVASW